MKSTQEALLFAATFFAAVVYHIHEVYSANCASYTEQDPCETAGCLWEDSTSSCYCGSNVTIDICFALDSSGSIGSDYFQIELDWLSDFVESSLSARSRVGIINFSYYSYMILNFTGSETMTTSELADFIENDIVYQSSWTNTVAAIKQGILMFEKETTDPETTKVLVIMTDGNPKLPTGGDVDVCAWASTLRADDINTYILGVGTSWAEEKVDCLVEDTTTDIIYVTSFNYSEFNKILPQLSDITCPVAYEVLITEVKVESDNQDGRTVPFVEVYNPSSDITLSDLTFSGVVSGTPTTDDSRILPQGHYLVLYDATYSGGGANVTCDECDCTHYAGGDWCSDSVYIGCDGTNCQFTGMANDDWYLNISDTGEGADVHLDEVVWDSTFPNLANLTGYSYELKNIGFSNDAGANWQPSCNIYGSPGYEPLTDCVFTCSLSLCMANGAKDVSVDGDECDCDNARHYYSDGCSCKLVPPPYDCEVFWRKNRTKVAIVRDYKFIWERADTDDDHQYRLCYPVNGNDQCVVLYPRYKVVTDFDSSIGAHVTAGTVQTVMHNTYSVKANCTSYTQSPTGVPTPAPTVEPTSAPSKLPTASPTFSNPTLWLTNICTRDRCDCADSNKTDCDGGRVYKQWAEGSQHFMTVKQDPLDFPYNTTVYWYVQSIGGTDSLNVSQIDDTGTGTGTEDEIDDESDTTRRRRRRILLRQDAMRRVLSEKFSKEVELDEISYLAAGSRVSSSIFASTAGIGFDTTFGDASSDITPTSGYVTVGIEYGLDGSASANSGRFVLSVLDDDDTFDDDYEVFRLRLHNCSIDADTYHTCSLIYPYELYIVLDNTNGSQTNVSEEEMPDWLWWVIAALVIFLAILAWLVYRYWWKNKQTYSALAETQDELDQAIAENNMGFGRDLGQGDVEFNPLATGAPDATRPTDAIGAELENRQKMMANERADVGVEKFRAKEQFGQVAPSKRGGGNDLTEPLL